MNGPVLVPLGGSPQAEQALPYARALLPEEGTFVVLQILPTTDPVLFEVDLLPEPGPRPVLVRRQAFAPRAAT